MQIPEYNTAQQETIPFSDSDFKFRFVHKRTTVLESAQLFHPEIEIKYFYDGEAWLLVGEDNLHVMPGDIVISNPYEIHSTIGFGDNPAKYYLMLIDLDFFAGELGGELDLTHLMLAKRMRFNHLIRNHSDLQSLFLQIARESESDKPYHRTAIRGLLQSFFALLLREEVNENASATTNRDSEKYYAVIEPALQKIRADYRTCLPVGMLAELCNVSKSHFCRIFKLVTGQTVVHYITDYRLKIAKLMLENSDYSIGQIAEQCGFLEDGYFSRCYKRKYQRSPKQDRAKNKKKIKK